MNFSKILIAIDDSIYSVKAAEHGFALAHKLGAEVALIHVIDLSSSTSTIDTALHAPEILADLRHQANQLMTHFIGIYGNHKEVKYFLPEGTPSTEIAQIALEWEADFIVIGTHGRSGLKKFLLGSVAEEVIRKADCPVFVVHEKPSK